MRNVSLVLLLFINFSCHSQQDSSRNLKPDQFEKAIEKNDIQLLDVRTPGEYNSGHIKNSLQADWNNKTEFNDRIQYVDKNRPVYVYCLVGGRSAAAASWMRQNGFTNVYELEGGINAWKKDRKPLEDQNDEPQMTIEQYWSKIPADKTVLVDFGAVWCPPCVKMAPVIDELQKSKDPDFLLEKIDAGVHTDVMKVLNIEPIPVFIIYKNGKETWRRQGIVSREELLAQLK
ncbi:MAG TPA: rhodanese-like domain-containing protein [Chitinophagaceae bacterium]|nr:rhodanese-like domain-containing protein [Chitinophagaceae bacterium]